MKLEDYARSAYASYGEFTGNKNYQGLEMPKWEALTPKIQGAWIAAVKKVLEIEGKSWESFY